MRHIILFITFILINHVANAASLTLYKSPDGASNVKLGGVIVYDVGHTNETNNSNSTHGAWRFARMDFQAALNKDWHFRYFNDFANGSVHTRDLWVAYDGFKNTRIIAGQFIEFNSISEMSAPANQFFLERSVSLTGLQALRNRGVGMLYHGPSYGIQVGFFGDSIGHAGDQDNGWGTTVRGYVFPILNESTHEVLHLGASYRYRKPNTHTEKFTARGNEGNLFAPLLTTPVIGNVDNSQNLTAESYYANGHVSMLATGRHTQVNTDSAVDHGFWGASVQINYMLTNDFHPYNSRMGSYGGVSPNRPIGKGGYGAWEIGVRMDKLDLDDGMINGHVYHANTYGISWWPTGNTRLTVNYIDNHVNQQRSPDYLIARVQFTF